MNPLLNFHHLASLEMNENLTCGEANMLLHDLGTLAEWWLKPEVFSIAGLPYIRPELPAVSGACWPILRSPNISDKSVMRNTMILPLIWKKGFSAHSCLLSNGLCALADDVRSLMARYTSDAIHWSLHPAMDIPDISTISEETDKWNSAWAALCAGLALALDQLLPTPGVFASAAWNGKLMPVFGLVEKAALAHEWGAFTFFFSLPDFDWDFTDPESCQLRALSENPISKIIKCKRIPEKNLPLEALKDYIAACAAQPLYDAPVNVLDNYYIRLRNRSERAAFYYNRILPILAPKIAQSYHSDITPLRNSTLISWVSDSTEVIALDVALFQPRRLILLATVGDALENAKKINAPCPVEIIPFLNDLRINDIAESLRILCHKISLDSNNIVADLTLGKPELRLALARQNMHNLTFLLWHSSKKNNVPIPSSVVPDFWGPSDILRS